MGNTSLIALRQTDISKCELDLWMGLAARSNFQPVAKQTDNRR